MKSALTLGGVAVAVLSTAGGAVAADAFSLDSVDSTKKTAKTLATDLLSYYRGDDVGEVPGILSPAKDYYWYEGAIMWSTLLDYVHVTGDTSHNEAIMRGMMFQTGKDDDYRPLNQTANIGSDDQGFWALAAMQAAELKFPDPTADRPQWLALAETVFNQMASPARYGEECGGGLRWQFLPVNNGYDYKNSISNGCFFNLGARLARYTGNKTYFDWAEKTWDWMETVGFIDSETYAIYDGASVTKNCTDINKIQFSENNAIFALGAAYMYNYTSGSEKWQKRTSKLVTHGLDYFFPDGVAYETSCESKNHCEKDMRLFKGLLHRWYATAAQIAPFLTAKVSPVLESSAEAAVAQCTGGDDGRHCGFHWASGKYDGGDRAEEEISVLGAVASVLMGGSAAPVTAERGTSKGLYGDDAHQGDEGGEGGEGDDEDGDYDGKDGDSKDGDDKDGDKDSPPTKGSGNGGSVAPKMGPNAGALAVIALSCVASIAASVAL